MLLVMLFDHVAKLSNSRSQMFFKRGVLNIIQDGGWGGGGGGGGGDKKAPLPVFSL